MKLAGATLIGKGRTAEIYAWDNGRILKLYLASLPAFLAKREFIVTRAAQAAGVPVPATEELVEIGDRCGIVFERVDGPSMLKTLQAKPWRLVATARQLAELQAQIHGCVVSSDLPSQRQQIENGIEAAEDLPEASKQIVRQYFTQLPDGDVLCHGDFHPDNVLMMAHGPVIIDWMTGTRGHPLADVARTSLLFQTVDLPPDLPPHVRLMFNASRRLLHTIYLNRYLHLRPAARRQIDVWQLPLMAARLREVENYPQEKRLLMTRIEATLTTLAHS